MTSGRRSRPCYLRTLCLSVVSTTGCGLASPCPSASVLDRLFRRLDPAVPNQRRPALQQECRPCRHRGRPLLGSGTMTMLAMPTSTAESPSATERTARSATSSPGTNIRAALVSGHPCPRGSTPSSGYLVLTQDLLLSHAAACRWAIRSTSPLTGSADRGQPAPCLPAHASLCRPWGRASTTCGRLPRWPWSRPLTATTRTGPPHSSATQSRRSSARSSDTSGTLPGGCAGAARHPGTAPGPPTPSSHLTHLRGRPPTSVELSRPSPRRRRRAPRRGDRCAGVPAAAHSTRPFPATTPPNSST